MRVALIVDNRKVSQWQREALTRLSREHELVLILNCVNTRTRKRPLKHALYYLLNLWAIRNQRSRKIPIDPSNAGDAPIVDFESQYRGSWQIIPEEVIQKVREAKVDAVIKFGMSLLVIPEPSTLSTPVLSFHHGDPSRYRGRPAGFYELLHDEECMGIMVQILSNELDAGAVVAYGESPLIRHSYKKTIIEAYRVSPLLLEQALRNVARRQEIERSRQGKIYRLPSNRLVLRFLFKQVTQLLRILFYGAFKEKWWRVSTTSVQASFFELSNNSSEEMVPVRSGYSFYADPFFLNSGSLVVEALSTRTGKGQLLVIQDERHLPVLSGAHHYSYPCVIHHQERLLVLPENATWGYPHLYELHDDRLSIWKRLDIEGDPRLIDPTLWSTPASFYLFGNEMRYGHHVLSLWHASAIDGRYQLHPASPIRISPRGARMGGNVVARSGELFRFGQNNTRAYGDGLIVFKIRILDAERYEEDEVGMIKFESRRGPHTLNFAGDRCCFDWYEERFAVAAGYRRIIARL